MAPAVAGAIETGAYQPIDMWATLFRLLLALVIVLPLAYWVTRLYSRRAMGGKGTALRVIDAVGLGPNRAIFLVEVGDRILVVGSTGQQVTLLAELTDPDAVDRIKNQAGGGSEATFATALGAAFGRIRRDRPEEPSE